MLGLMQEWPLLCHKLIDHAALQHGNREIVSRSIEGPIVRTTYAEVHARARKVSQRLEREGYGLGDRIATLAWNTARHLEAWYGIMGVGAIYHTLNPRLFPEQLVWIMNHAEDKAIFVDLTFMPLLEKIAGSVKSLKQVIVLTDSAHMPQTALPNVVCYEDWLAGADGDFRWKTFDENTAAGMCYTSGTTGEPKGVLYSHRSNVLHAMIASMPDAMGISSRDVVMPVVPMFHANAWGLGQSGPMTGAKIIMPGSKMDGASIYELLDGEKVTFTAAVPTIWLMLLQYLEETGKKLPYLNRVVIGGSAAPRAIIQKFQRDYGVEVIHAWGMTEMSPLGTLCTMKPEQAALDDDALLDLKQTQGYTPFGIEMRITDDDNVAQPWDGVTFGRLKVRGPAVSSAYYGNAGTEQFDAEGWFDTGDVAHINADGYMRITDRAKDVIKSGGEWISTIELENLAVGHQDVAEAAVIGVHHPKWDERPLLVIVRKPGKQLTKEDLLAFMQGKVARWWMPDDVAFVDEIPHTATGKIQKTTLRKQFEDYKLPTE
ncbi:long-chain fatty acid--CoA ligase [Mesorhizobium sp. Root554]|uniref:fatty-acid--CoA ligase n=1 Tax=unclassified Mesorhizobium TaxID=325217 RepID=UPI0006FE258D|nr:MULTISPECIES: fatty-acid--CoA ligase [unclassified Mesorhizobium]KQZ12898.1 long-chain fatty acid--CoA ligase [Mesorhizobium sp. Root1471]KQZ35417.1 long-chain fatty acid--CoA ligase [Mesorhizobium sp. Root554]